MQPDLEIATRLGNLEGALKSLKDHNQDDHDHFQRQVDCLTKKVVEAQLDLKGTAEQLRGSLDTVTDLELETQTLRGEVENIKHSREINWMMHDQKCERCIERLIQTVKNIVEENSSRTENLGVIALLKHYWWQAIIAAVVLSAVIKIDNTLLSLFIKHLLGGK